MPSSTQKPAIECLIAQIREEPSTPVCLLHIDKTGGDSQEATAYRSKELVHVGGFTVNCEKQIVREALFTLLTDSKIAVRRLVEALATHALQTGVVDAQSEQGFATIEPRVFFDPEHGKVTTNGRAFTVENDADKRRLRMIHDWIHLRTAIEDLLQQAHAYGYEHHEISGIV